MQVKCSLRIQKWRTLFAAVALVALAGAQRASATTRLVNNNTDDGVGVVPGTLRWAIHGASPGDTIVINTENGIGVVKPLTIAIPVTINGGGWQIRGIGQGDIFVFAPGSAGSVVSNLSVIANQDGHAIRSVSSLTIDHAAVSGGANGGAAIYFEGGESLTINASQIVGGSAAQLGGGIYLAGFKEALLDNVLVSDCSTGGDGGGLYGSVAAGAVLTIRNSQFLRNIAGAAGAGSGMGGGIATVGAGTVLLSHVLLGGNSASGRGGGIFSAASLALSSSTLAGNTSASDGGGLAAMQAVVSVTNTTLAQNAAANAGGVFLDGGSLNGTFTTITSNAATTRGGGVLIVDATAMILDSILGANQAPLDADLAMDLSTATISYSLVGNRPASGVNDARGNLWGVPPVLGALSNNGGGTQTCKPLPGSPVFNAGDPGFQDSMAQDQRDLPRIVEGRADMGSVEGASCEGASVGTSCPDDGAACTADSCDAGGTCTHTVASGACFIGDNCYADGATNPANPCESCVAATSQTNWTPISCGGGGATGSANLVATPATLDFGNVVAGEPVSLTLKLSADGGSVAVSSITVQGDAFSIVSPPSMPASVDTAGIDLQVSCSSPSSGPTTGKLVVSGHMPATNATQTLVEIPLQANIQACSAAIASCTQSLADNQSLLAACSQNLASANGTVETLQSSLGSCNANLASCNGQLQTCTGALAAKQIELDTRTSALAVCSASLDQTAASLADTRTNLLVCTANAATCAADLDSTRAALNAAQAQLTSMAQDHAALLATLAACRDSLGTCQQQVSDLDGDGEIDRTDACPNTPPGTKVDSAGCSQEQFCARIDTKSPTGAARCILADFLGDEPFGAANDCAVVRQKDGTLFCKAIR